MKTKVSHISNQKKLSVSKFCYTCFLLLQMHWSALCLVVAGASAAATPERAAAVEEGADRDGKCEFFPSQPFVPF